MHSIHNLEYLQKQIHKAIHITLTLVKVQNFQNPELKKFSFLNLQDAYKIE